MSDDKSKNSEHRADPREPFKSPVVLRPCVDPIPGVSDNISKEGIMFYTQVDLRVVVEFDGKDGKETRTGRVVRVNRIGAKETGMAVEFDRE